MKNRGFTLIELLVVIAIIGILSSVVLASLTTARSRGSSASVQNQLANMRAQAELYYSTTGNNSYGPAQTITPCSSASAGNLFTGTNGLGNLITGVRNVVTTSADVQCISTLTAWAVAARDPASTTNSFCVDSTGASKSVSSASAVTAALSGAACL